MSFSQHTSLFKYEHIRLATTNLRRCKGVFMFWMTFCFVTFNRGRLTERFFAIFALKGSFTGMRSLMAAEARLFIKTFVANRTEMSFLFCVLFSMKNDRISVCEPKTDNLWLIDRGNNENHSFIKIF